MGRRTGRLVLSLVAVAAVLGGALVWGWVRFHAPGPLPSPATVIIPKGAGLPQIATVLAAEAVISRRSLFMAGVWLSGRARGLRAGEYALAAGLSMDAVAAALVSGKTVQRRLTVPEGLTNAQVLALVNAADGLEGEVPPLAEQGELLPDTYFYAYGDSRGEVVARMRRAMTELVDRMWPTGAPVAQPGAHSVGRVHTRREATTLASIIELETPRDNERARISAVFHNRLARGMRLQSDATVAFAVTGGAGPLDRPLTKADLAAPSPYNTYLHRGLPPGPIANPGRVSLDAALNPADTGDLYFVADGSGGHVFAKTLAEHNRNVARWRRAQRARDASP